MKLLVAYRRKISSNELLLSEKLFYKIVNNHFLAQTTFGNNLPVEIDFSFCIHEKINEASRRMNENKFYNRRSAIIRAS